MESITAIDTRALRVAMAMRGIRTVRALARLAKVSPQYCQHITHGLIPDLPTRRALAEALGVSPGEIWFQVKR